MWQIALSGSLSSHPLARTIILSLSRFSVMSATLIVVDFPAGCHFGIDLSQWQVGPKFRGIGNIPFGTHLIYTSCGEFDSRSSMFVTFSVSTRHVAVLSWSTELEQLLPERMIESDEYLLRKYVGQLGPYPSEQVATWHGHAHFLDPSVIREIQPVNSGAISSESQGPTLFWSRVPKVKVQPGSVGSSLTCAHLDKSDVLEGLLGRYRDELGTLSEYHSAFLLFFLGQNFTALEQWKSLLLLFAQSQRLAEVRPRLFAEFAKCLCLQVNLLPDDFLIDPLTEYSLVAAAIADLVELSDFSDLCNVMVRKFGKDWKELALSAEDLPTVVDN
jgi:AAR2 protein